MIWREGSLDILLMKQEIKVGRQEARQAGIKAGRKKENRQPEVGQPDRK